jgi:hypothetical protein
MGTNFFPPLFFIAVFESGIRDKHPGSATLPFSILSGEDQLPYSPALYIFVNIVGTTFLE